MNRTASIVAITAVLSACAPSESGIYAAKTGGARTVEHASADEAAPVRPQAPAARELGGSMDSAAPAAAASQAEGGPLERESDARPGLGTQWGETRSSRVSSAPFERNHPSNPFAVSTIHYNDADGVRAMARSASFGAPTHDGIPVAGGALSVRLLDAAGRPLPTYDSGTRRFVVGSDGDRYVVQIRNHTGNRFEAVTTVDGLDVIDGRSGAFEKRGYLLGPWATVEIDGFRQNLEQVAAFRFGSVRDSYAAKKGDDRNVGVIGVAFFAEQNAPSPFLQPEVERRHDADPFPGRFAAPPRY